MRRSGISAVLACPAAAEALSGALRAPSGLRAARVVDDAADLLATLHAGLGGVVFVGVDLPGLDLACLTEVRSLGVAVVGVVPAAPTDSVEARLTFVDLGVDVLVGADTDPAALRAAADRALRAEGSDSGPRARIVGGTSGRDVTAAAHRSALAASGALWREVGPEALEPGVAGRGPGRVVAVWGPTGAPGRSTIAASLATIAARSRPCLLLDLDVYGAAQAHLFALPTESSAVVAAVHSAGHGLLDAARVDDLAVPVRPDLRLLTGPVAADAWPRLRADGVEQLLRVARTVADLVVVDCGFCLEDDAEISYDTRAPRRNAATLTALAGSDDVVVVAGADRLGLARLLAAWPDLEAAVDPRVRRRVVLNRVRAASARDAAAMVGPAGPADTADLHLVPDDPASLDAALVAGLAVPDVAPDSEMTAALERLARDLTAPPGVRRSR